MFKEQAGYKTGPGFSLYLSSLFGNVRDPREGSGEPGSSLTGLEKEE